MSVVVRALVSDGCRFFSFSTMQNLVEYFCTLFACDCVDSLREFLKDDANRAKAVDHIREKKLKANMAHLKEDLTLRFHDISKRGAHKQWLNPSRSLCTVALYLKVKHSKDLQHPKLPCIVCRAPRGYYQFPLEVVMIETE